MTYKVLNLKFLSVGILSLAGVAALESPASAAPAPSATGALSTHATSATNVEWRYRHYRDGRRERYWYGPRIIRRIIRDL